MSVNTPDTDAYDTIDIEVTEGVAHAPVTDPQSIAIPAIEETRGVLTVSQQAMYDVARVQARGSTDAMEIVNGPVGQILAGGSRYKRDLLHNMLVAAYIRGSSFGSQLAIERLVAGDLAELDIAEATADAKRDLIPAIITAVVMPAVVEACPGLSSIDGVCTVCNRKVSEHQRS
jgi:hypothetical protein